MSLAPDEPSLCLFNTSAYHGANIGAGEAYLRIDHIAEGRLIGTLAGVKAGETLDCGWRAPFGGIDLGPGVQTASEIADLVRGVVDRARAAGAARLRVRCRPAYASPNEAMVQFALLAEGFAVEAAEISQGVDLRAIAGAEAYRASLGETARKRLRRLEAAKPRWAAAAGEAEWAQGYGVLAASRARLGAQLKYSLDYLLAMAARFGPRIRMMLLRSGDGSALAAALIYRVLPRLDYVAAWGDADRKQLNSAMYLVAARVVEDALSAGVEVVDLGVSSVAGRPNDGLIAFKRHVGAAAGLRLDLIRNLEP